MQTQRIAIVLPDLMPPAGAERLAMTIAEDQLARGYRVDLVLLNEEHDFTEIVPPAVRVIILGARKLRDSMLPLMRYLKREKPRTVLASMWPLTSIVTVAIRLAGVKARVVVSDHNPLSIQYAKWGFNYRLVLSATIRLT